MNYKNLPDGAYLSKSLFRRIGVDSASRVEFEPVENGPEQLCYFIATDSTPDIARSAIGSALNAGLVYVYTKPKEVKKIEIKPEPKPVHKVDWHKTVKKPKR